MLFKCAVINKEIKNANKITLDINVKDDKSNTGKNFEIFIKRIRTKSIFGNYYKTCLVINAILYVSMIFLIMKISKNKATKTENMKNIQKLFTILYIICFLFFFNSIILFNNILYLNLLSEICINALFVIFVFYIFFLIVFLICFFTFKMDFSDKTYEFTVNIGITGLISIIISLITSTIIFLFINISYFFRKIHTNVLFIICIFISLLINIYLIYKCHHTIKEICWFI